ncbi:MAG: hypothetical protein EU549_04570, partial [Promethearchaeota archaeon]
MEKKTKQIAAIVAIVVIAAASGIGVWLYLSLRSPYWVTPGAPSDITEDQYIKVGCLGDLNDIQGQGNYKGAYLRAKELNEAGGVTVGNTTYYFALAKEDTGESRPVLDESIGLAAAQRLLDAGAEFFVGGFRTESCEVYREPIMDAQKIFFGTGSADNGMCEAVDEDYPKYKYWFRTMPINGTALATQQLWFIVALQGYLNNTYYPTEEIDTAVILRENLDWTDAFNNTNTFHLGLEGLTGMTVHDYPYDSAATAEDFDDIWDDIKGLGADIVIPVISAGTGIFMSSKWKASAAPCIVSGINVESQEKSYWDETDGAGEYETTMVPLTRTNKTEITLDYYDRFIAQWGAPPLYTATGAYDSLTLLHDAINQTKSFDVDTLITYFEGGEWVGTSASVNKFIFTVNHDILAWMGP